MKTEEEKVVSCKTPSTKKVIKNELSVKYPREISPVSLHLKKDLL
jgi:hypothetical protein